MQTRSQQQAPRANSSREQWERGPCSSRWQSNCLPRWLAAGREAERSGENQRGSDNWFVHLVTPGPAVQISNELALVGYGPAQRSTQSFEQDRNGMGGATIRIRRRRSYPSNELSAATRRDSRTGEHHCAPPSRPGQALLPFSCSAARWVGSKRNQTPRQRRKPPDLGTSAPPAAPAVPRTARVGHIHAVRDPRSACYRPTRAQSGSTWPAQRPKPPDVGTSAARAPTPLPRGTTKPRRVLGVGVSRSERANQLGGLTWPAPRSRQAANAWSRTAGGSRRATPGRRCRRCPDRRGP